MDLIFSGESVERVPHLGSTLFSIFLVVVLGNVKRERVGTQKKERERWRDQPKRLLAFFFHYGTVLWWRWIKTVPFFCARCCLFFFFAFHRYVVFFFGSVGMLVLLLVGCCSIVGQLFRFSAHVRFRLSCCEFFGMNRDSSFLRVQQSGQPTVSPDHLLGALLNNFYGATQSV